MLRRETHVFMTKVPLWRKIALFAQFKQHYVHVYLYIYEIIYNTAVPTYSNTLCGLKKENDLLLRLPLNRKLNR